MDHGTALIAGGGIALVFFFVMLVVVTSIFWIVALIDAARRQFDSDTTKIIWICVILFSHFVGSLVYWFAGRPTGRIMGSSY